MVKPRKHARLWQAYLWWHEMMELRKAHNLRISAAERGVSSLDPDFEREMIERMRLDVHVDPRNKAERSVSIKELMIAEGRQVGPIWDWCMAIKGIGEGLTAQLIAQVDDIANFDTVSRLWRFCGYGVYRYWLKDGKPVAPLDGWKWVDYKGSRYKQWTITTDPDRQMLYRVDQDPAFQPYEVDVYNHFPAPVKSVKGELRFVEPHDDWHPVVKLVDREEGWELRRHRDVNIPRWHSPYNRLLKGVCFNILDQFVRQQTPVYVDLYYAEKERQRTLHPEPVKNGRSKKYSDGHIDYRAKRKMVKRFLRDFWEAWRGFEGLPVKSEAELARHEAGFGD